MRNGKRWTESHHFLIGSFKEGEVHSLETPPLVDAAVIKLVGHISLPMDDAVSFKDALDRKMDADVRKVYIFSASAGRLVLALTSVARTIKVWTESCYSW